MPRVLLELFSGTGSVGRAFRAAGWRVISVDNDPRWSPDILGDVRELTAADLPEQPHLIWASPVCTHYSKARTRARTPRDLEWADSLVAATLRLQRETGAPLLFENPASGLLRTREVVAGIPFARVDYCVYASADEHHCRKRTGIWQVGCHWEPKRPLCSWDCPYSRRGCHFEQACGRDFLRPMHGAALYPLPAALCEELAEWASAMPERGA
jgi:hypothetical protein